MSRAGGPMAAAEIFESWAMGYAAYDNAPAREQAEMLRARAERCRALASKGLT